MQCRDGHQSPGENSSGNHDTIARRTEAAAGYAHRHAFQRHPGAASELPGFSSLSRKSLVANVCDEPCFSRREDVRSLAGLDAKLEADRLLRAATNASDEAAEKMLGKRRDLLGIADSASPASPASSGVGGAASSPSPPFSSSSSASSGTRSSMELESTEEIPAGTKRSRE